MINNIFLLHFSDKSELASEVYQLKSELSELAASFESRKKSLVKSLETKLATKKCKWIDIETKGRISGFILKGEEDHAQKWTGLCYSARLSFWNFLGGIHIFFLLAKQPWATAGSHTHWVKTC